MISLKTIFKYSLIKIIKILIRLYLKKSLQNIKINLLLLLSLIITLKKASYLKVLEQIKIITL